MQLAAKQKELLEQAEAVLKAEAKVASLTGQAPPEPLRDKQTPAPANLLQQIVDIDLDDPVALGLADDLGDVADLDAESMRKVAEVKKQLPESY